MKTYETVDRLAIVEVVATTVLVALLLSIGVMNLQAGLVISGVAFVVMAALFAVTVIDWVRRIRVRITVDTSGISCRTAPQWSYRYDEIGAAQVRRVRTLAGTSSHLLLWLRHVDRGDLGMLRRSKSLRFGLPRDMNLLVAPVPDNFKLADPAGDR